MNIKGLIVDAINIFFASKKYQESKEKDSLVIYKYHFGGNYSCVQCRGSLSGKSYWHIPWSNFFGLNVDTLKICFNCAPTTRQAFAWVRARKQELRVAQQAELERRFAVTSDLSMQ